MLLKEAFTPSAHEGGLNSECSCMRISLLVLLQEASTYKCSYRSPPVKVLLLEASTL